MANNTTTNDAPLKFAFNKDVEGYKGTFKGRFEFVKDIRSFFLAVAYAPALIRVENVNYDVGMPHPDRPDLILISEPEVEFSIWAHDSSPNYTIRDFLRHMKKVADDAVGYGVETHVFRESVKLIDDYDGERDCVYSE